MPRGAPKRAVPNGAQGAPSSYKKLVNEPADHAIGRSRGRMTTKIHALADTARAPVTMVLTAGQSSDNPQLLPLVESHKTVDRSPFRLLGDKAYSHPSTRRQLRTLSIPHTIPGRTDQIERRKAKGSAGGRPPAFGKDVYRERNTIERGFNRLKHWRAIPTRYDNINRHDLVDLPPQAVEVGVRNESMRHCPVFGPSVHADCDDEGEKEDP
jgi:putative transposase